MKNERTSNLHRSFHTPSPTPYSVSKIIRSLPPTKNFVTKFPFLCSKYKTLGLLQVPLVIFMLH